MDIVPIFCSPYIKPIGLFYHPIPTYGTLETHLPNISQVHFQRIMLLPSNIVSKVLPKNHRTVFFCNSHTNPRLGTPVNGSGSSKPTPPPALSVPLSPSGLSASASTSAWRFSFQKCPRIGWSRILGIFMQLATVPNDHRVGCLPNLI